MSWFKILMFGGRSLCTLILTNYTLCGDYWVSIGMWRLCLYFTSMGAMYSVHSFLT